ncbi:MAG TPA: TonB-dependent receptor [Caulobacteraceae bacterium]|nr:TonB-dependent receptor [Caulobacteraceae bacterium]
MTRSIRHLKRDLIATSCLAAIVVGTPLAAHAADASATGAAAAVAATPTVVVTAERRAVNIQKAPLAITAVSARQIDQAGVNLVSGLNAVVPSLEVTKASGFENLVSIRGVGSETPENSLTTVPGVSEFVDGVYIANTISLDQTLFDLADIEVLRGPQGALYGESSIGGAILINTVQPRLNAFDAQADVTAGSYNLFRERGEVNIPISDDFALRVSGQKYDHDGFTKDALIPGFDLDDAHDGSIKVALLWRPNSHFSATLTAQGYFANQHGDAQKNINDPSADPRVVFQNYPAHFQLQNDLVHLNLELDEPDYIIKSVTGYQYLAHQQREDSSRSAFSLIGQYDDVAAWDTWVNNVTEEFDVLSPAGQTFEWTVGAFYMNQQSHQFVLEFECTNPAIFGGCSPPPTTFKAPPLPADPLDPPAGLQHPGSLEPSNLSYGNDSHAVHWSAAAFAQATYHVSDAFRITAGIRYNHDYDRDPSLNFSAFGQSFLDNSISTDEPTWRVEADYDLTPVNLVYASVARGYKPGAANGSAGFILPATAKAETNDAFELGSRNLFFDNTLRLNVTAFYNIHHNFQYIETDPVPFAGGIANVPQIEDYGVEFEADYVSPDGRLNLNGSLALERGQVVGSYKTLDSTIANAIEGPNFTGGFFGPCAFFSAFGSPTAPTPANLTCWNAVVAAESNISRKQPPDMPNVSGSAAMSYRFTTPIGDFTPRAEVVYRGDEWARIFNQPGLDHVPDYTVVNLDLDFVPAGNRRLRLSLTGTNVFNVAGITSRYTDPFGTFTTSNQYIPPAQIMGTIAWTY